MVAERSSSVLFDSAAEIGEVRINVSQFISPFQPRGDSFR